MMSRYPFKRIIDSQYLFILILITLLTGCISSPGEFKKVDDHQPAIVITNDSHSSTVKYYPEIYVEDLPEEARNTLNLIRDGGPFPFAKDGSIFNNYEGLLPKKYPGYYREYTVITIGSNDRGPRRIIAGKNGEFYYTDDHYRSFRRIVY